MKWVVLYAIERWDEVEGENINQASEKANQNKREGETVVRIGIR